MKLAVSIFLLSIVTTTSVFAKSLDCPCKVIKVTDGDTINVLDRAKATHKIRLGGIDAPERKQAFGQKSKQNLSRLIAGQDVEVEYDKRGKYGRIIGKVIMDGIDINLLQIKHGYAWHYKHYQKDQSKLDRYVYSATENEAKGFETGLWAAPAMPPWEFRRIK